MVVLHLIPSPLSTALSSAFPTARQVTISRRSPYMEVVDTGDAELNLPVLVALFLPNIKLIFNFLLAIIP